MNAVFWLAAAVFTLSSLPLTSQQTANANGGQSASVSAGSAQVNDSSNGSANGSVGKRQANASGVLANSGSVSGPHGAQASTDGSAAGFAQMRPVTGELQGNLDSKSARTGQPVILKTTRKMRTADGTELPKGTRLLGHVTDVQAHRKGHKDSELGLEFDRAELKGGRTIPIHSMIESIQPRPSAMMSDSMGADGFAGGSGMMGAGPALAGGGGRLGGGVLGGGAGIAGSGMAGGTVGGIAGAGSRMGEAANGSLGAANRLGGNGAAMAGNAAGMVNTSVQGAAGASGALATHATGIPGVLLSGDATGSASGMLSATNRNVHLDSGTQMVLGVAAAAQ